MKDESKTGRIHPSSFILIKGEAWPMRSLLRSILGCFTLGKSTASSGQSDNSSAPADVVAHVPGLTWPRGWPDRVRNALATLPWVEQGTIQMNFKARELRFCLKDKSQFNDEALKKALKAEGFPGVQLKAGPSWVRSQRSEIRGQRSADFWPLISDLWPLMESIHVRKL